jgi:general secretion pathway protein D
MTRHHCSNPARRVVVAVLWLLALPALAQEPGGTTITPNYKEADIRQIVEAVGAVTNRNFIVDPRVNAKVTMLSATPMSPEAFYEAFLSVLEVHGFVAIETGNVVKIIPDAAARQYPTPGADTAEDMITQVLEVRNVNAAQLVPVLRPLIPQYGHLASAPGTNMLIISDRAANMQRIVEIIRRIDVSTDDEVEVIRLQHATASEVVRVLTTLAQAPRADGMPVTTNMVADARTNSVLIGGEQSERLRLRALIAHLDTPLEDGGSTQVRYLRYADAEELAGKLQEQISGMQAQSAAAGAQPAGQAGANAGEASVWADVQTNALVINAPPKMMRSLLSIVDKLDIRRPQVLVEAIIVEVTADKTSELGITWAVDGSADNNAVGVTNFPDAGPGVVQLGSAIGLGDDVNPADLIGSGITLGVGRISDTGTSFAAILRALQGDANTNIISTPSIVTTDNEEASINVGQEVPFLTGSFSNVGTGTGGGVVNPFQTIQREQIGTKLTITPQISEGNTLILDISQEISSIAPSAQGAVDIVTNQRTIETTVIVEDGDILVLGGLIEDTLRESEQRVPLLGSVPLLGNLFRTRTTDKVKTNLLVFIRPKILRDSRQAASETEAKYNYIREMQQGGRPRFGPQVPMLPGAERPILPPLEPGRRGEDPENDPEND